MGFGVNTTYKAVSASADPHTIPNVVVDGDITLITVTVQTRAANSITSITRDGQTFTEEIEDSNTVRSHIYYLKTPNQGTADVVIDFGAAASVIASATTWDDGWDGHGSPFSNSGSDFGTGETATVTVASADGEIMYDSVVVFSPTAASLAADGAQVELHNDTSSGNTQGGSSTKPGASPNVTMTWTWTTSDAWVHCAGSVMASQLGSHGQIF